MKTLPLTHTAHARPQRQRGAVAVLTGILIALLVGFGALVVDLGRLYVFKTELQNAMDACALAASGALTGTNDPGIFNVARARGLAMLDASRRNIDEQARDASMVHFQRDRLDLARVAVEFSESMGGPWSTGGNPAATKYARCSYDDTGIPLLLARALNVFRAADAPPRTDAEVAAYAVARLAPGQSACAMPVAMCKAGPAPSFGLVPGKRYTAVQQTGQNQYGTGNFGWLDFTPPNGGASELADLILGEGSCSIAPGTQVGAQGQINSLQQAWNTRFGVYSPGSQYTAAKAPPDYTGYSYPSGDNNYPLYMARAATRAPFQGSAGNSTILNSTQHAELGKSRRIVVTTVVDCSTWNSGNGSAQPQVEGFACALMLSPVQTGGNPWSQVAPEIAIEHLGMANEPGSPCATSGLPGGSFGPPVPTLVQ